MRMLIKIWRYMAEFGYLATDVSLTYNALQYHQSTRFKQDDWPPFFQVGDCEL